MDDIDLFKKVFVSRYISAIIAGIIIMIITDRIDVRNQKEYREKKGSKYIVCKEPKELLWIFWLGLFATLALLFAYISTSGGDFIWVSILIGSLPVFSAIVVFCAVNSRIELFRDQPYFLYRTGFRRTYKIYYDQCQLIHDRRPTRYGYRDDIILKVDKKSFRFDKSITNYYSFIEIMREHDIEETWKFRKKKGRKRRKRRKTKR